MHSTINFGAKRQLSIYQGHYFITIQMVRKTDYSSVDNLNEVITWLKLNGLKTNYMVYEANGRYGQTHVHIMGYKRGRYKHLTTYGDGTHFPRYQILWKPIYSFRGCHDYIYKFNEFERDQQISEHFYKTNYGFIY